MYTRLGLRIQPADLLRSSRALAIAASSANHSQSAPMCKLLKRSVRFRNISAVTVDYKRCRNPKEGAPAVSKFEIIILSAVTILLAVGFFAAFGPGL